jgi:hypothetical protein
MGFEPTTLGITIRCSNQLSYNHRRENYNTMARPTGIEPVTAGLEGRCSIRLSYGRSSRDSRIEAHKLRYVRPKMVGVERFELPTSCSQSRRATRLRYTPIKHIPSLLICVPIDIGKHQMARPEGFEPPTPKFVAWCSIQLSYGRNRSGIMKDQVLSRQRGNHFFTLCDDSLTTSTAPQWFLHLNILMQQQP